MTVTVRKPDQPTYDPRHDTRKGKTQDWGKNPQSTASPSPSNTCENNAYKKITQSQLANPPYTICFPLPPASDTKPAILDTCFHFLTVVPLKDTVLDLHSTLRWAGLPFATAEKNPFGILPSFDA